MKIATHAGRHKTGRKYLQQFLGLHAPQLLKNFGISYSESGRNQHFNYHYGLLQTRPLYLSSQTSCFFHEIALGLGTLSKLTCYLFWRPTSCEEPLCLYYRKLINDSVSVANWNG